MNEWMNEFQQKTKLASPPLLFRTWVYSFVWVPYGYHPDCDHFHLGLLVPDLQDISNVCAGLYIFLWPIPHKHILAPCMVNLASIFVRISTCHIWVEKIKKQMWRAENWHLDCSLAAALPALLKCPERCRNKKGCSPQPWKGWLSDSRVPRSRISLPAGTAEVEAGEKGFLCLS